MRNPSAFFSSTNPSFLKFPAWDLFRAQESANRCYSSPNSSPLIRASDRLESCRLGRFSQRQERLPQTVTKSRRARGQAQVVPVAGGTITTMSSGLASSTTLDRAALTPKGTKSRWYWPVGATAISPPSKETRSASCHLVGAWASCQLFCVPLIGFECLIRVSRRGFHR